MWCICSLALFSLLPLVFACWWLCDFFSRCIQKATSNFTTIIGHGAFGSVYKAQMLTGETAAVKVLGTNSRQGEKEFLTEVGNNKWCSFELQLWLFGGPW